VETASRLIVFEKSEFTLDQWIHALTSDTHTGAHIKDPHGNRVNPFISLMPGEKGRLSYVISRRQGSRDAKSYTITHMIIGEEPTVSSYLEYKTNEHTHGEAVIELKPESLIASYTRENSGEGTDKLCNVTVYAMLEGGPKSNLYNGPMRIRPR
jgi:hypothetical protein